MTMTFDRTDLDHAIRALKTDLTAPGGPRISTMQNYNFAILPYEPQDELKLRARIKRLSEELKAEGWAVCSIALHRLLLDRLKRLGDGRLESLVERERALAEDDPDGALEHLTEVLARHIEGPDGLAADVAQVLSDFRAGLAPETPSVAFIGRAGALYPFFRTSALLRHIDGRTGDVPVVLLYPGKRRELSALSFMGELQPDRDYRPRIYPRRRCASKSSSVRR
jgi:hypothetical protein